MVRPGIQLYTLRDVDLPLPEILDLVADAVFGGVEFAYRVARAGTDEVRSALDETGLDVAGVGDVVRGNCTDWLIYEGTIEDDELETLDDAAATVIDLCGGQGPLLVVRTLLVPDPGTRTDERTR